MHHHPHLAPPSAPITLLNGTPVARVVSSPIEEQLKGNHITIHDFNNTQLRRNSSRQHSTHQAEENYTNQNPHLPKSYIPLRSYIPGERDPRVPIGDLHLRHSRTSSRCSSRALSFLAAEKTQQDPRKSQSARLYDHCASSPQLHLPRLSFSRHKQRNKGKQTVPAVDVQARLRGLEKQIEKEKLEKEANSSKPIQQAQEVEPSSESEDEDNHIQSPFWTEEAQELQFQTDPSTPEDDQQPCPSQHLYSTNEKEEEDTEIPTSPSLHISPSSSRRIRSTMDTLQYSEVLHRDLSLSQLPSIPKTDQVVNDIMSASSTEVSTIDRRKSEHRPHPQHHRIPQLTLPPLPPWHDDIDDSDFEHHESIGMTLGFNAHECEMPQSVSANNDEELNQIESSDNNIGMNHFETQQQINISPEQEEEEDDDECASPLSSDASTPPSSSPLNYYIHNGYRYDGDVFELRPPQERSIASRPERILEYKPALLSHRQVFHRVYSEGTYNTRPSSLRAQSRKLSSSRDSPNTPRSLSALASPDSSPARGLMMMANSQPLSLTTDDINIDIPGHEAPSRPVHRPGSTRPPPVDTSATAIAAAAAAAAVESAKVAPDADTVAAVVTAAAAAARDARAAVREKAKLNQSSPGAEVSGESQSMPVIIPPRSHRQPGLCETIEAVKQSATANRNHNLQGLIAFSGVAVTKIEGGKPDVPPSKSGILALERRPRRMSDMNMDYVDKSVYADPVYHEGEDENRHPGVLREKRGRSYTSFARNNPYGRKHREEKDKDAKLTEKDAHPHVNNNNNNSANSKDKDSNSKRAHFWKILSR